jgi:hypothetical protein
MIPIWVGIILWIGAVGVLFYFVITRNRTLWATLLVLKVLCGVLLGYLYISRYPGGDTWGFHHDALVLNGQLDELLIYANQPRALWMSKLVSLVQNLVGYDYWTTSIWFSLIGFTGMYGVIYEATQLNRTYYIPALFSTMFIPSMVFWSSGVMKETLTIPAFFIFMILTIRCLLDRKLKLYQWLFWLISLLVLIFLKYYLLGLLGISLIPFGVNQILSKTTFHKTLFTLLGSLILVWVAYQVGPLLHPNFSVNHLFPNLVASHEMGLYGGENALYIYLNSLSPSAFSVLKNIPGAFIQSIIRPYLWEVHHDLQFIAAFESMVLIFICSWALFTWVKTKFAGFRYLHLSLFLLVILAGGLMAISNPNLGTLSRMRITYIPILFFMAAYQLMDYYGIDAKKLFHPDE